MQKRGRMFAKALFAAATLLVVACAHAATDDPDVTITASYPEGPLFHGEKLYFAEMGADRISVLEAGQERIFFRQPGCGPTAIAPYGEGFLVLCHISARAVAVDANGRVLRTWARDEEGAALRDPNDASADGRGGVYFSDPGAFSKQTRPHGYLMHLSAEGELRRVAGPLWYPNGVFVDQAAGAVFVSEHMTGRILRFAQEAGGGVGAPDVFANVTDLNLAPLYDTDYPETGPDGLEIGPNGDLFVALYGGGRILRFSPSGQLVGDIPTAPRFVTNLAFGPEGEAATTGPFENLRAPFRGEVRVLSAARLTRSPD